MLNSVSDSRLRTLLSFIQFISMKITKTFVKIETNVQNEKNKKNIVHMHVYHGLFMYNWRRIFFVNQKTETNQKHAKKTKYLKIDVNWNSEMISDSLSQLSAKAKECVPIKSRDANIRDFITQQTSENKV